MGTGGTLPVDGEAVRDMMGAVALMALLAVVYGSVLRRIGPMRPARMLLGSIFGLAAVLTMRDPIVLETGYFLDLRTIPIALAGAFLGRSGLLVALGVGLGDRVAQGGGGALTGCVGMASAGLAGLLWSRWTLRPERRGLLPLLGLGGGTSLWLASLLVAPAAAAWTLLLPSLQLILPLHVAGIVVVGGLLERERVTHLAVRGLRIEAERDALTGLLNRRGFERAMARLPEGAGGALLVLDLDHFKGVNDRFGHPAGDAVLRATAGRLRAGVRPGDLVARLGGEEMAAFLPGCDPQAAREVASRLHAAIRGEPFALPSGGTVPATASIGGAWGAPASLEALLARADAALYSAKRTGRDRVCFAAEGPSRPGRAAEEGDPAPAPLFQEGRRRSA